MEKHEQLYDELYEMAKRIEEIRIELFNDKGHKDNLTFEDTFQESDDELFRISGQLSRLVYNVFKGED